VLFRSYGNVLSRNLSEYEDVTLVRGQPQVARIKATKEEPLKIELKSFVESIKNKNAPLIDGLSGIRNLELSLAAVKSAKTGRPIFCS
jgi:predicted dehydrogenase